MSVREAGVNGGNRRRGLVANLTSSGRVPRFYVTGLRPDTGYVVSVTAINAKGSSDALMVRAYTRKSDGLRQLIETSESALATNVANTHRGNGFVDSVWFLGTIHAWQLLCFTC